MISGILSVAIFQYPLFIRIRLFKTSFEMFSFRSSNLIQYLKQVYREKYSCSLKKKLEISGKNRKDNGIRLTAHMKSSPNCTTIILILILISAILSVTASKYPAFYQNSVFRGLVLMVSFTDTKVIRQFIKKVFLHFKNSISRKNREVNSIRR